MTEGRCLAEEDENSNTSVHLAAAKGHLEVVKLLVSHGADKLSRLLTCALLLLYNLCAFTRVYIVSLHAVFTLSEEMKMCMYFV